MENEERKKSYLVTFIVVFVIVALVGFTVYTFVIDKPDTNNGSQRNEVTNKTDVVALGIHKSLTDDEDDNSYLTIFKKDGTVKDVLKFDSSQVKVLYSDGKMAIVAEKGDKLVFEKIDLTKEDYEKTVIAEDEEDEFDMFESTFDFITFNDNNVIFYNDFNVFELDLKNKDNIGKIFEAGIEVPVENNGIIYYQKEVNDSNKTKGYTFSLDSYKSENYSALDDAALYFFKGSSLYVKAVSKWSGNEATEFKFYTYNLDGSSKKEISEEDFYTNKAKDVITIYNGNKVLYDSYLNTVTVGDKTYNLSKPSEIGSALYTVYDNATKIYIETVAYSKPSSENIGSGIYSDTCAIIDLKANDIKDYTKDKECSYKGEQPKEDYSLMYIVK